MRIGIVNQHPQDALGGSEIQCDLIAREMLERGHEVAYVAPRCREGIWPDVPYHVVQVERNAKNILTALRDCLPDVVYWRFNKHFFRAVAKGLFAVNIPVVFAISNRNDVAAWLRLKNSLNLAAVSATLRHRWNHGGFRYVSAVTALNKELMDCLRVPRQYYVPNAMEGAAKEFQWSRPYCVWVANIKKHKRPEIAVALAEALEPASVDVIMVGHLNAAEYSWLTQAERLPCNCHFLGPKSVGEVNGIIAKSLLHVHTCEPEGFGNVFIQAWLQGRPSVSLGFDPGGYLASENIGVSTGNDFEKFVATVNDLIRDRVQREEMGARARVFAERTFTVARLADDLERIFGEAVAINARS